MKKVTINQKELSNILKLSTRQCRTLGNRGILVRVGVRYDLVKSISGYIKFLRSRKESKSFEEIKKIFLEEKTKKLRIESEKMLGNLVPRKEGEEQLRAHVELAKEGFQNLGWRLASPLLAIKNPDGKDFSLTVQYAVDEILRVMSGDEKPETPVILPGRGLLLQIGLIKPDSEGFVILDDKKVKADELLEKWGEK